jgi:hypothetical protein
MYVVNIYTLPIKKYLSILLNSVFKKNCCLSFQIRQMSRIGGVGVREIVSCMIKRLLTNRVAAQFNLIGHKGKMPFSTLGVYRIIIGELQC